MLGNLILSLEFVYACGEERIQIKMTARIIVLKEERSHIGFISLSFLSDSTFFGKDKRRDSSNLNLELKIIVPYDNYHKVLVKFNFGVKLF